MEAIDNTCADVIDKTPGAVACGVVDLATGSIVGISNIADYPPELNEYVAAATVDLFRGSSVANVEQLVRSHRRERETGEHYFQEIHIASKNNFHFCKVIGGGRAAVVLVTRKSTSPGMGWAMLRAALPTLERCV